MGGFGPQIPEIPIPGILGPPKTPHFGGVLDPLLGPFGPQTHHPLHVHIPRLKRPLGYALCACGVTGC